MADVCQCDICGKVFDPRESGENEYCDICFEWFKRMKVRIWSDAKRGIEDEILKRKAEFGRD